MTVTIEPGASDTSTTTFLYDNIYLDGTVTVSSETPDGFGANALGDETFDFWTPDVAPANIAVDYGSGVECDCAGIAAHNAGTLGATILVQSSTDNIAWTTRSTIAPLTDETIFTIFPAVTAQYWRVVIQDVVCSIGVIKLGKRLVMPNAALSGHVGANHANRIELMASKSVKGQFMKSRIIRQGAEFSIALGLIDTSFVDNQMGVFEAHFNEGNTFFYAGSPSQYPDDYGYCRRMGSEFNPSYEEGGNLMSVEFEVDCYVE